jgi:hypothetical protein
MLNVQHPEMHRSRARTRRLLLQQAATFGTCVCITRSVAFNEPPKSERVFFVTSHTKHCVGAFGVDRRLVARWDNMVQVQATFVSQIGIAHCPKTHNVLICDCGNNRIQMFMLTADGIFRHSVDVCFDATDPDADGMCCASA